MLASAPTPPPDRHAYVAGTATRTGKDGRVYRLCADCGDRANAWTHRGFRTTPATIRERSEHHAFVAGDDVKLDARGYRYPLCATCGLPQRATEHGGLTAPVPSDPDPAPALRVVPPVDEAPRGVRGRRAVPERIAPPPAELTMLALAVDRMLALPTDVVDLTLRLRLMSVRELIEVPCFPTLDARLTVDETAQASPDDADDAPAGSVVDAIVPRRPLSPAPVVLSSTIVRGIRSDRIRELARRAVAAGFSASKTGSGHIALDKGATRIIVSTTAETGRRGHSWGNARAHAKRAGIDVAGL